MHTVVAEYSQFDFPFGSASCTSASLLFARYVLEGVPTVGDINKILEAGALLWKKWRASERSPEFFQTWKNVQNTFPMILTDVDVVYEANGYLGTEVLDKDEYLLGTIGTCIDNLKDKKARGAVFTSNATSFGLAQVGGEYFFFDSHGCPRTDGKAFVARFLDAGAMRDFVLRRTTTGAEFTAVVLQKRSACTEDTPVGAQTTGADKHCGNDGRRVLP